MDRENLEFKAYENRKDRMSKMVKKGYDIKMRIKNIEKAYRERKVYSLISVGIGVCAG